MTQDKKILIYEAALSLVYENLDLSRIKVADIAEKAKIGKSTVYEYFDSKEQVIGEALIYMFKRSIESFDILDKDISFKQAYIQQLRSISAMLTKNRNLFNLMTTNQKNLDIHTSIQQMMHSKMEELKKDYFQRIEVLVDKSVQEGIIKAKPSRFDWQTAVLCSMNYLFVHQQFIDEFGDIDIEEVLEKAYQAYVKLLS